MKDDKQKEEKQTNDQRDKLKLVVHYPPAEQPFKDDSVNPSETVGQLKQRVLQAFELEEGQSSDGSTISYTLYEKKIPLENLSQTLGEISGGQKNLQFKLSQQITQG